MKPSMNRLFHWIMALTNFMFAGTFTLCCAGIILIMCKGQATHKDLVMAVLFFALTAQSLCGGFHLMRKWADIDTNEEKKEE